MIPKEEAQNFEIFRDCFSEYLITKLCPTPTQSGKKRSVKGRKNGTKAEATETSETQDAEELSDFVEYLSDEMFPELPTDLRTISYPVVQNDSDVAEKYTHPLGPDVMTEITRTLPATLSDSLCTYSLLSDPSDLDRFLEPVISNYIETTTSAPPEYAPALSTYLLKMSGCEICEREQLPLTYHHLIPREVHAKAVKRGWHKEWQLNKVAWLCRACHSFVHKIATNEELAKDLYDVALLLEREDVQRFAAWVGKVRWKAR